MALWYSAGFRVPSGYTITVAGTPHSVTAGLYAHYDMSLVIDPDNAVQYSPLDSRITTDVGGGYTMAFSTSTYKYTFSKAGGNFTLAMTSALATLMGYSSTSYTGANSYTAENTPRFHMVPNVDARSDVSNLQEPDDLGTEAVSDGGVAYVTTRTTADKLSDWTQACEPIASVYTRSSGSAYCDWQRFFAQCRGTHPFQVRDGSTGYVYRFRADGVSFRPRRFATDDDTYWMIDFRTRDLGTNYP